MEIMSGLKPEDATHFAGEIYNADDGKMYNVTVSMEKEAELQVRGCLLHFLCGSQSWARVADIPVAGTTVAAKATTTPVKLPKTGAGSLRAHDSQPAH